MVEPIDVPMSTEELGRLLRDSSPEVDAAGSSHTGLKRKGNEDAFTYGRVGRYVEVLGSSVAPTGDAGRLEQDGWFAVVADGMGGRAAGEVASRAALAASLEATMRRSAWVTHVSGDDVPDALDRMRALVERVHQAVSTVARSSSVLAGMGSTFTLARIVGSSLLIGHIGDSRIYLLRRGVLRQLTKDQTSAQLLADLGEIRPEEVARHSASHLLTQSIGSGRPIQAEVRHLWLLPGDVLLLATDGLTGPVPEADLTAILGADSPPAAIVERLIAKALEGGGPDNVTAIVARIVHLPRREGGSDATTSTLVRYRVPIPPE